MRKNLTRRKFIETTLGAGVAVAGIQVAFSENLDSEKARKMVDNQYDAKGLPTTVLGKTGVVIPKMAIGLGSRFLNIATLDEAIEMCNYALDSGLYYWDTAHDYVNEATGAVSEERLGNIIKHRRKEIFLSTKISARDPEKAKVQIEESLKRLQTDHVDMLKIHSVESIEDVNNICKSDGVLDLFSQMKNEGVARFIGFSGHGNAQALKAMVDTGRFDSMLFAMNHYGDNKENRQGTLIPSAKQRGMGVMLMKTVRPKETIQGIDPKELVRFALSLEGPDGIAVGMDSKKVVESNLNLLRNFKPMNDAEKSKYAMFLSPYFRHENLEWMRNGYRDGYSG
ncbi:MAG: aldo/keto reductase [Bacteroidales bacterium]|jgi:predicted aldo/keto reductase-like oxidoreductase